MTLDDAWAEVEATQKYGRIRSLVEYRDGWEAVWTDGHRVVGEFGHTPVEALQALAKRLRPPMTVTVDLEDNPTLVGWVMNDE